MARIQQKVRGEQEEPARGGSRLLLLGGLLLALVVVLGVIAFVGRDTGGSDFASQFSDLQTEGRFLGSPDAPVLVRDFSDFSCPHCRDAAETLLPRIAEEYVTADQVRIEVIPVAVLGQGSVNAAQAALCAEEQGQFWRYHDTLYNNQGQVDFTRLENLVTLANEAGLNVGEFQSCLASGKYLRQVDANNSEFRRVGGQGTPTFLVGSELIGGAVPFDQMQPVIERQLGNQ